MVQDKTSSKNKIIKYYTTVKCSNKINKPK